MKLPLLALALLSSLGFAAELPDGITMKESVPIRNATMTETKRDYFRNGVKFFSDVTMAVPGAPKEVRSYRFHHDGVMFLEVDPDGRNVYYAGNKDYRFWIRKDSVTVYCLDDDFHVLVSFDESGNPIFQSKEKDASNRQHYIKHKDRYQLHKEP